MMQSKLALVIPCYNESHRLHAGLFLDALRHLPNLSFCFVNDGSTDATAETLAFLSRESPAIDAIYLPRNEGKADAVRAGMRFLEAHSNADLFGFWDADLSTPLSEIPAFLSRMEASPWCQAVAGVRWPHLGARIQRSAFRGLASGIMKALIRFYLKVPIFDSQCGAKIFRRDLAISLFEEPFVSRWLLDVELYKRMGYLGLRHHLYELPLEDWREVEGSKLTPADAMKVFRDFFRIARCYSPCRPV